MKAAVLNYQGKANALINALQSCGHEVLPPNARADVLIVDHDYDNTDRRRLIQVQKARLGRVYIYSHGANPNFGWDGIWSPFREIDGYLAMNEGQKAVMEAYGYPHPIHVIGWHYCEIAPFRPCPNPRRVLFAPCHPHNTGWLHPEIRELNSLIFSGLLTWNAEITVRHVGKLEDAGLWHSDRVEYVKGGGNATADIDAADLLIGYGTIAYLAIARGCPTIMYGQDIHPHESYHAGHRVNSASWEKYRELMRYPYGWLTTKAYTVEPLEWKRRFIGDPFDAEKFCSIVEGLDHV